MFTSRRKEAFRYIFNKPLSCVYEIIEINGSAITSKKATAQLIDISRNGCRLEMKLNLNSKANRIQLKMVLKITDKEIPITGYVRWQRSSLSYHSYGILFEKSHDLGATIVEELMKFTKDSKNAPKVG
ncbi:PilZ domain-containing protein [Paenibacillus agricola]|uniref:PilZ domain-containing protein n=1 Tax=Paenibacillus agricola TaxID=2716264 RepID=A0ABX0J1C7_9BACL|nr:PilZ domain-containing protein [Paenibacillus agricola]NHN29260.1 PilZ domain-containing protein [Paenibacillus agricola]